MSETERIAFEQEEAELAKKKDKDDCVVM